jgi:hypothetical protein
MQNKTVAYLPNVSLDLHQFANLLEMTSINKSVS